MVRPTLSVVPVQEIERAEGTPGQPGVSARGWMTDQVHREQASLNSLIGEVDWTLRAVCVGADPDALFVTGAAQRDAAKICQACPVRLECLADALDNQIEYGVWGGMTERQRRAVLKKSPEVTSWRTVLEEARSSTTQEAAS